MVENGGFTAAERATGIPKSKLSRRVSVLEEQLGIRLLQRSAAGQAFHAHCAVMIEAARAAEDSVASVRAEVAGVLHVSCPTMLAQNFVAPLLPGFTARYPKLRVALNATDRSVDVIEEHTMSRCARASLDEDPGLVARVFGDTRLVLVASVPYLRGRPSPETPADLRRMDTISSLRDPFGRDAEWRFEDDEGGIATVQHTPKLFCQDLGVQVQAALQGIGVALVPEPVVKPALLSGELVQLLPQWTSSKEILHAVYPTRRGMLPSLRAFLDYMAEHLPPSLGLRA